MLEKMTNQQKKMKGMFIGKKASIFGKDRRYSVDLKKNDKYGRTHKGWWNLFFFSWQYQIKENFKKWLHKWTSYQVHFIIFA